MEDDVPNRVYRDRVIGRIRAALSEVQETTGLEHLGMRGRAREIAIENLVRPLLPDGLQIASGTVTDAHGAHSRQSDVIIYDPRLIAPVMFDQSCAVIPVHACLAVIEIKSELSADELRRAIEGGASVRALDLPSMDVAVLGLSDPRSPELQLGRVLPARPIRALFAFTTDLSGTGKSELDRYRELDDRAASDPAIRMICVPRHGFWRIDQPEPGWNVSPPSDVFDEVLDFLGLMINQLAGIAQSRGLPALGEYIIEPRPWTHLGP